MNDDTPQTDPSPETDDRKQKERANELSARANHHKALIGYLERTRNDNGQTLSASTVEMKSKLSLVVTLDGIYTAPRFDMVVKEKSSRGKFYPSENAGERHHALVNRHIAHWQNNMESAEGRQAVGRPRHTLRGVAEQKITKTIPPKEAIRSSEKEIDHE
jgi:hypothetical protein